MKGKQNYKKSQKLSCHIHFIFLCIEKETNWQFSCLYAMPHMLKSYSPVSQNVTMFRDEVFKGN